MAFDKRFHTFVASGPVAGDYLSADIQHELNLNPFGLGGRPQHFDCVLERM